MKKKRSSLIWKDYLYIYNILLKKETDLSAKCTKFNRANDKFDSNDSIFNPFLYEGKSIELLKGDDIKKISEQLAISKKYEIEPPNCFFYLIDNPNYEAV